MSWHRSILAWALALLVGVALSAGGCASGGGDSASGTDGGGTGDGTVGEGGDDGGCTGGKVACGGKCTSTTNDPKNCGKCGTVCGTGQVCTQGVCGVSCSSGETLCGGPSEAGAPEASTGDDGSTEAGGEGGSDAGGSDSGTPVVDSGSGAGDGGVVAPYCANLNSDPANCGTCGNSCGQNGMCVNGSCSLTCPTGQKPCFANGTCIPNNSCCQSGECTISGEVCPMPGATCQCPAGETECTANMACITTGTCCTTSDCNKNGVTGQTCTTPGQPCKCSHTGAGQCCAPSDCTGGNVSTYTCTSNTCGVGACKSGCYDLNGMATDGCECCADTNGHACASPTTVSTPLTVGTMLSYPGTIPSQTGEDWFSVTFSGESNTAFHGLISLTTNPNNEFVFDVLSGGCPGTPLTCGEGGGCSAKTAWEESYSGPSPPADPASPTFTAIPAIGTVLIRVYRASMSAPATCSQYTLSISE